MGKFATSGKSFARNVRHLALLPFHDNEEERLLELGTYSDSVQARCRMQNRGGIENSDLKKSLGGLCVYVTLQGPYLRYSAATTQRV